MNTEVLLDGNLGQSRKNTLQKWQIKETELRYARWLVLLGLKLIIGYKIAGNETDGPGNQAQGRVQLLKISVSW